MSANGATESASIARARAPVTHRRCKTPAPMPTVAAITSGITREIERTPNPLRSAIWDCTPCRVG